MPAPSTRHFEVLLTSETPVSSSDTATGTDAGETLDVTITDADTGTGTDTGSITADLSDAETGTGTDAGEVISLSDADTGTAVDGGESIDISIEVTDNDSGSAVDAGETLTAAVSGADTGTSTEAGSVNQAVSSVQQSSITAEDVLDMVPGLGVVKSSMVFDILDKNLNFLFRVHPVTSDAVSIVANTASTVKRTLSSFHLDQDEEPLIDIFQHRLRPSWKVEAPAGTVLYPLGVFIFSDANRPRSTAGLELKGSMYDQTVILDQGIGGSFGLPTGTLISDAILSIAAGVGLSGPLVNIDYSAALTTAPIAWRLGTSRYKILNELAQIAGYYPAFFDNNGVLRFKLAPPSLTNIFPDHTYNGGPSSRMIAGSLLETDDQATSPNRWLVVNSGSTDVEISGYYDLPASAPGSFANRGYRIVKRVDEQGIESSAQATARAQQLAITDFNAFGWVQFNATPDPRHDLFDTVEYLHENYYEVGWTLRGTVGGPHTHKLRKIYTDA